MRGATIARVALALLPFVALAVFLSPLTSTWYLGDDAYLAYAPDAASRDGLSLVDVIRSDIEGGLRHGRFSPLSAVWGYTLFAATPSLFVYKLVVAAVVMLAAATGALFLRTLGFPWPVAALVPVAFCALLQFRYWHDPVLAYAAHMPALTALLLGTMALLAHGVRRRSAPLVAVAVVLFAVACLFYEATPLLAPLAAVTAWCAADGDLRRTLRLSLPFAVVAVLAVGVVAVARSHASADSEWASLYRPSFAPDRVAAGLAKQASGSLPLSYFAAIAAGPDVPASPPEWTADAYGAANTGETVIPSLVLSERSFVRGALSSGRSWLVFLLVAATVFLLAAAARGRPVAGRPLIAAGAFAAWLLLGSSLGLAISYRWQGGTAFGVAYLAVFLGYAAVAVAAAAALGWLVARDPARASRWTATAIVVAVAVGGTAAATDALNRRVVAAFSGVADTMNLFGDAVRAGLMGNPGKGGTIVLDGRTPLTPQFVRALDGPGMPGTTRALADEQVRACRNDGAACSGLRGAVAPSTGVSPDGIRWVAVCHVDLAASRRAGALACGRTLDVVVAEEAARGCGRLTVVALAAGGAHAALRPVPLGPGRASRTQTICRAQTPAATLLGSVQLAPGVSPQTLRPRIVELLPPRTTVGVPFNVQPNGEAAIAVRTSGATPTARLLANGTPLASRVVSSTLVTAIVPRSFFATPRRLSFVLEDRGVRSNAEPFAVVPAGQGRAPGS